MAFPQHNPLKKKKKKNAQSNHDALNFIKMYCIALNYVALNCIALNCITLNCIAFH